MLQIGAEKLTKNLPLIRLSAANPFLMEVVRRQAQPGHLLRELGLPRTVPASSELFVSPHTMYELVERCARLVDDSFFGYRIGADLRLEDWEPIKAATKCASTVAELFLRFVMKAREHTSSTTFYLETTGERTSFGFRRAVTPRIIPAQNDAFYLGFISRLLIQATQQEWDPTRAIFQVADPTVCPPTTTRLRIVEGDNSGVSAIFPADWLLMPFERSLFSSAAEATEHAHMPDSLVESLHSALMPHIHDPNLTVDRVAEICGFERRKLSSSLRAAGTTIAKEIAAARSVRAKSQLLETDRRVADIAVSVGFGDPTVFSRAFKNWTGKSPQQYRSTYRT